MKKDAVRKILWGFLILGLNLLLAYTEIIIWGIFTTPGNPVRPIPPGINILGFMGFYIGLSQIIHMGPLLFFATQSRKQVLVEGLILGAVLTALLNVILLQLN